MREVNIRIIEDKKLRVELAWSPRDNGSEKENEVTDVFKELLDMALKGILGEETGYGEGDTCEEARVKAFIDRDIRTAGKGENDGN